jgi:hypothetical protein
MKRRLASRASLPPVIVERPLTPEFLGKKGEEIFASITPDAQLVTNKARDMDTMGWDYFLEFPHVHIEGLSFDKRPHPIECKIQIKTVWDDNNSVTLTLSAADKLARSPLPSFIIVVKINHALQQSGMYGFHMLDGNLSKILKRLRQATAKNSLNINKEEIEFNLNNAAKIAPNGFALRDYILNCCGENLDAYIKAKSDQIANLGFPERRISMSFRLKEASRDAVNEVFLGLRDAEVTKFETKEIRFGVKLPVSFEKTARITVTPQPVAKCKVSLRSRKYSIPIRIEADIFVPPFQAKDSFVCRISNDYIDIIMANESLELKNKFDDNVPMPVEDMLWILKIQDIFYGEEGFVEVSVGGKKFREGSINTRPDSKAQEYWAHQVYVANALRNIFQTASIRDLKVSRSDILATELDILLLNDLIVNEKGVKLNRLQIVPQNDQALEPQYDGVFIRRIELGSKAVAFYFAVTVCIETVDNAVILEFVDLSLRDISEIDENEISYKEYCDEAKRVMGLDLVLMMNYEFTTIESND